MTQEIIKKAVKYADGFTYYNNSFYPNHISYKYKDGIEEVLDLRAIKGWRSYHLFLDEVIKGINDGTAFEIDIRYNHSRGEWYYTVDEIHENKKFFIKSNFFNAKAQNEVKEAAIEYVLEEIERNKTYIGHWDMNIEYKEGDMAFFVDGIYRKEVVISENGTRHFAFVFVRE